MRKHIGLGICLTALAISLGCSQSEQRQADRRADEARAKARELGRKAEQSARQMKEQINTAVAQGRNDGSIESAKAKLRAGAADLRQAGLKATLITRVKTQLANDVGLKTVGGIEVETQGGVVTLRGTVSSAGQKSEAEQAAGRVPGVTSVVNDLLVQQ